MGKLLLLAMVLLCCGCSGERAQQAANARAGIHAGVIAVKAGEIDKGVSILAAADGHLAAVAEVPSVDFPAPAMTAEAIMADPQKYAASVPPEPKGWGLQAIAIATTLGGAALYALKLVAPALPGGGPLVAGVANAAWAFLTHGGQRTADKARDTVHDYAPLLQTLLSEAKGIPGLGAKIPPELEAAVAVLVKST